MKKYQFIVAGNLPVSSLVELTDKQAKRRSHALENQGKNVYRVMKPVMFKAGEEIGFDGDLPKNIASSVAEKKPAKKKVTVKKADEVSG